MKYLYRAVGTLILIMLAACSAGDRSTYTVTALPSPAAPDSGEPRLSSTSAGLPVLSWLEHGDITRLKFTILDNGAWQPPQTVAEGANWVVNWADFPSVVPIDETLWAAHWLEYNADEGYAYDVALAVSTDAGRSWQAPVRPHNDGTATEHGFVSLFSWQSGIGAVWLDGRNMAENAATPGGMTLRFAAVHTDSTISSARLVDDLVCDCCQTAAANTADGPIVTYRNRTTDEIRDIYVVRAMGDKWQKPVRVAADNWQISGCPVNGPAIAAQASRVAVAWYTAADKQPRIKLAWSEDGAASFGQPSAIDVGAVMGRVSVLLTDDNTAIVGWLRRGAQGDGEICARRVSTDGVMGEIRVIARTAVTRNSGFPQFALAGDQLIIARTDVSADKPRVVTHLVDATAI